MEKINKRQVIFIMTDTQRKDMVGCYGNPDMQTPNLDRLAAQGVRFEKAYTCQPVCGPARAALFTGTYPHTNGAWANHMAPTGSFKNIGRRLVDRGIRTAYIGKWHLDGGDYFGMGKCPEGWDPAYWYDMRTYLEELTPEERLLSRDPITNETPGVTPEFTYGHRCSNRAIDFLKKHGGDEFFLVLSYDEPHGPFLCPKPYSHMYKDYRFPKSPNVWDKLEGKPEHQRIWAGETLHEDKDALEIRLQPFLGCNCYVDSEIGRVLEVIDALAPDALVIYTSDHGDMLASHSLWGKGAAMYQEVTNIPFIVRWPGQTPQGAVSNRLISHIDLCPTIMDAFGFPIPKLFEGKSVLPVFRSPTAQVDDLVFMEFNRFEYDHDGNGGFQPIRCCFDGRYKLAINLLTSDELYDLREDPQEMTNLIVSPGHHVIRDRLHNRILEWMNQTRDPFRGYCWERRPWRTDATFPTWPYTRFKRQRENEEYEPRQLDYHTGLDVTKAVKEDPCPLREDFKDRSKIFG